jgi:hypothetical protein
MKEENSKNYLKELFYDCKKGEKGVMPYFEKSTTFYYAIKKLLQLKLFEQVGKDLFYRE